MWQFGGTDVPFCDLSLTNTVGLGNFGFTQPFFGNTTPIGYLPYGTPQLGFTPFVQPTSFFKTDWTPFYGLKDFTTPMFWGSPFGIDKLNFLKLNTMGLSPWSVSGPIGFNPVEELWHRTVPFTTPFTSHTFPFTGSVGLFGTPFGITNYSPFGFTPIDERIKFHSPITTGLFGFQTTPFQTPIDWKVKTFGTPMGIGTDTWKKSVCTSIPWTGQIPGPVAVL